MSLLFPQAPAPAAFSRPRRQPPWKAPPDADWPVPLAGRVILSRVFLGLRASRHPVPYTVQAWISLDGPEKRTSLDLGNRDAGGAAARGSARGILCDGAKEGKAKLSLGVPVPRRRGVDQGTKGGAPSAHLY